ALGLDAHALELDVVEPRPVGTSGDAPREDREPDGVRRLHTMASGPVPRTALLSSFVSPESRRARCSSAALTNAAKSGCGSSGRLLNSGWNWQPMKYGWFLISIISASRPSGLRPEMRSPAA